MKEIDFLPKWYKDARRRRWWYRMQYAVILCLLAGMVGWNFFSARLLSKAQAAIKQQQLSPAQKQMLDECVQIQTKLSKLSKQAGMLKKLDSKIIVADVLAELSFFSDSRLILTQVDMQAEVLDDNGRTDADGPGSVRVAKTLSGGQTAPLVGDVRFKVSLQGLACEASDAAGFICKLESSPYFCQVLPVFSRTSKLKDRQVSEFGINCYVANYREVKQ
jgi:hypothetical protein